MYLGFPLDTDELYPALGHYVRLSLTLAAGANWSPTSGNMTIIVATGTGSPAKATAGYTGQVNVISVTQAITSSVTRYQFSSPVVVPTNTRQMEITLQWTPVGTAGVVDGFVLDDVQLEIVPAATGYVASNFERLIFEEQLLLCQRHFMKSFPYATAPAQNGGTNGSVAFSQAVAATTNQLGIGFSLPVIPRVAGTGTLYNPSATNAEIRNSTATADWSSSVISVGSGGSLYISVQGVTPGGTVAGQACRVHYTLDAGI